MNNTKRKLKNDEVVLGGWTLLGHPGIVEVLAGEGFDFIVADMEHSAIDIRGFHDIALAVKGTDCDILARLQSCDPDQAKHVLDNGANGIIVPSVNSREQAEKSVAMAKFPPEGFRGSSLSRATGYGQDFKEYFDSHNDNVLIVIMLEHIDAVENIDEILSTPGIDAAFIGPYDLSASMGIAGELDHVDLLSAQQKLVDACKMHNVPAGIHVVSVDNAQLKKRIEQGMRFIACGIDTLFIRHGCRIMLEGFRENG